MLISLWPPGVPIRMGWFSRNHRLEASIFSTYKLRGLALFVEFWRHAPLLTIIYSFFHILLMWVGKNYKENEGTMPFDNFIQTDVKIGPAFGSAASNTQQITAALVPSTSGIGCRPVGATSPFATVPCTT